MRSLRVICRISLPARSGVRRRRCRWWFSAGIKYETMRLDAVALDLQMPDKDGFAFCRPLRSTSCHERPRVVALSGFLSAENSQPIQEAGADFWLAKTTAPDLLIREPGLDESTYTRAKNSSASSPRAFAHRQFLPVCA